jgi:hypothetical protein
VAGVTPRAKTFTPKQGQYLACIHPYTRLHRRPPAQPTSGNILGSHHLQFRMVLTLERAGFIRRQPGVARSIEVLVAKLLPELL